MRSTATLTTPRAASSACLATQKPPPNWPGRGICLSSANSINWGRLAPQIVYYFFAYFRLVESGAAAWGQPVDFCVPTGNFGDILAGYYAKRMGLPVGKLICASNKNNVLADFIRTGPTTKRREFYKTGPRRRWTF